MWGDGGSRNSQNNKRTRVVYRSLGHMSRNTQISNKRDSATRVHQDILTDQ